MRWLLRAERLVRWAILHLQLAWLRVRQDLHAAWREPW